MAPAIPDRWLDYKPIGERIEGTRFVAFKVPLREEIIKNLEPEIQLDVNILLKLIPNMGLIIDLTNTRRYYKPDFFEKQGVKHCKVMIPGRLVPPQPLVDRFKGIVKDFIECNHDNDKLIGIHCTHGVNRTGFLICNYMISEMNVDPIEAINRFDGARGHKIERTNYLNSLHRLLNNEEASETYDDNKDRTKRTVVENWRTEKRDQRSYWKTKSRNDNRNRDPEISYNNNSYNNRYSPMKRISSHRSYEHDNSQPRLRTDYYNERETHHHVSRPRHRSGRSQNQDSTDL